MGKLLAGILGTISEFAGIVFVISPFWIPIALLIILYIVLAVILSR